MDNLNDLQERAGPGVERNRAAVGTEHVRRVHAVFKTHLDVGFTDSARSVVQAYFTDFIPRALEVAAELRRRGGSERLSWTTGSWLIHQFLEQASTEQRRCMDDAIEAGDVTWHALPLTFHSEYMDASLFRFGLRLSAELDQRYGRRTIAAKMTDVPGHTRSIVPLLDDAGIEFLHLGVNPASPQPNVPPLFRWRGPADSEVTVMYNSGYGATLTLPCLEEILSFAHRGENSGPPSCDDVIEHFQCLRRQFPNAEVLPSTMDCFAATLKPVFAGLPVISSEIGDSWIHGVGTDPAKSARFRALCRLRSDWERSGRVEADDPAYARFSRTLLLIPEHTWGKDEKTHLAGVPSKQCVAMPKDTVYEPQAFKRARQTDRFRAFEDSWNEQRAYITDAVAQLQDDGQLAAVSRALNDTVPAVPDVDLFSTCDPDAVRAFETEHFTGGIDSATGALDRLILRKNGCQVASPDHLLGLFRYQTFSQADYDRFLRDYTVNMEHEWCYHWALPDFSKPGIDRVGAESRLTAPTCTWVGRRIMADRTVILVKLHFDDTLTHAYGAPAAAFIEYQFADAAPTIEVTLQWFEKNATRLPESMWFSFAPAVSNPDSWSLDKMGSPVSPLDVVRDGNRNLHAVTRGVQCGSADERIAIDSLDVPLVAPGEPRLLQFDNRLPALEGGMHFNILNNVWGTNFPMWYEDDGKCRFRLRFQA